MLRRMKVTYEVDSDKLMTIRTHTTFPHRLHRWLTRTPADVLNKGTTTALPDDLLGQLKTLQSAIADQAFSADGKHVDYAALRASDAYHDYRALIPALARMDLHQLATRQQRLAFWINLYNLLTVDAVLYYGVQRDINEAHSVFYRAGYNVGGLFFSLHDVEQGLLRANAGHPAVPGPQFGTNDPRRQHALVTPDARIHFALVCAAESCPPIRLYAAEQIDAQLDLATANFVNSSAVQLDPPTKTARLSKIFQWYATDFGAPFSVTLGFGDATPLLRWVAPYLADEALSAQVESDAADYAISFLAYNWSLNGLP